MPIWRYLVLNDRVTAHLVERNCLAARLVAQATTDTTTTADGDDKDAA